MQPRDPGSSRTQPNRPGSKSMLHGFSDQFPERNLLLSRSRSHECRQVRVSGHRRPRTRCDQNGVAAQVRENDNTLTRARLHKMLFLGMRIGLIG